MTRRSPHKNDAECDEQENREDTCHGEHAVPLVVIFFFLIEDFIPGESGAREAS